MDDSARRQAREESPGRSGPQTAAASPSTDGPGTSKRFSGLLDPPLPRYVDWLVAVVIAIGGLLLVAGGAILTSLVDRDLVREGLKSGQLTVTSFDRELSTAESLAFTSEVVEWTALGLLVTGVAMLLFAVGYAVVRYRVQDRTAAGDSAWTYRSYAVLGTTTSAVFTFVPFSPVVGGALAGYTGSQDGGEQLKIGALSGLLVVFPVLASLAFVAIGLVNGFGAIGNAGLGVVIVPVVAVGALFLAGFGAGLGALGGFIGGRLAADDGF